MREAPEAYPVPARRARQHPHFGPYRQLRLAARRGTARAAPDLVTPLHGVQVRRGEVSTPRPGQDRHRHRRPNGKLLVSVSFAYGLYFEAFTL